MINNVVLVGRITKDPELRYTPSNVATVSFSIAIDRAYQSQNGERQADFINCVAWRQSAEFLAKYVKKGYMIGVTGSIQTRNYQAQDGTTRYVTEVVCNSVQNLQGRNDAADNSGYQAQPSQRVSAPKTQEKQPDKFDVSEVAEDDLPF
jgi:single-strand DNA-binding protein